MLDEMDRQHDITRVLEREGERLPALRDEFRREISEASYAAVAEVLRAWLGPADPEPDLRALAVHLLGGLVNARRSTWTLGAPPAGMDDERTARAWADLCVRLVRGGLTSGG